MLRRACLLLGAAEHLMAQGGFDLYHADREEYEHSLEIARSGLDAAAFAAFRAAKAKAEAMSLKEVVDYALGF